MNPDKIYREILPCVLTPEQTNARGEEAAKIQGDIERAQEAKKESAADFNSTLEGLATKRAKLCQEIRERREFREVETIIRRNETERMMETVRTDTGETVRSRPMDRHELQLELLPVADEAAGEREGPKDSAEAES